MYKEQICFWRNAKNLKTWLDVGDGVSARLLMTKLLTEYGELINDCIYDMKLVLETTVEIGCSDQL